MGEAKRESTILRHVLQVRRRQVEIETHKDPLRNPLPGAIYPLINLTQNNTEVRGWEKNGNAYWRCAQGTAAVAKRRRSVCTKRRS